MNSDNDMPCHQAHKPDANKKIGHSQRMNGWSLQDVSENIHILLCF